MSIWGSQSVCGEVSEDDERFDGSVVSYVDGWSNHYPGDFPPARDKARNPANDLTEETPASIGTGWIAPGCVPGHQDTDLDVDTHLGPWLRLDLMMRTVSIWAGVEIGNQDVHSVCLNETAVTALRDNLTDWLTREKVHPKETS